MRRFSTISIIYNPISTGPSEKRARSLARSLKTKLQKTEVNLVPTEFATHAEQLAYEIARQSKYALVISVSGDGGYNEVINGVLRAKTEGHKAVSGLLPAGNANDHFHSLHAGDFIENIVNQEIRTIDTLRLTATVEGSPITRYAHSYIGFGFTPRIGRELTKHKLNRFNEIWIVAKTLLSFRQTRLVVNDSERAYYSLVCTNIGRMGKILHLAQESNPSDGVFEVSSILKQSRLRLFFHLLQASVTGAYSTAQLRMLNFKTVRRTLVQLDGEILRIDPGCDVHVDIEPASLDCIV